MEKPVLKRPVFLWVFVVLTLPVLVFAAVNWWERRFQPLPQFTTIEGWQPTGDTTPACHAPLIDQDERTVRLTDFPGRVVVVNFFFSRCPLICPRIMQHMQQVHTATAGDKQLQLLSLTVDPGFDQPAVLKRYATRYTADGEQWRLLTGDKQAIYRIARQDLHVTATDGDGGPTDFIHTDRLALIDPAGHIRGYYDGTSDRSVQQLISDLKKLEHEL